MEEKIQLPIIFFEESPHKPEVQEKAKLLNFNTILFLATNTLEEFYNLKRKYLEINPQLDIGWWPMFKSVWLSPFTNPKEIEKVIQALFERKDKSQKLKILLDLEFPFLRPHYFLLGLFYFRKSKKLIAQLIKKSEEMNVEIYSFEYPPHFLIFPCLLETLGVTYLKLPQNFKRIVSCYTSSVLVGLRQMIKKSTLYAWKRKKREMFVALGLFASGKIRIERRIKPAGLEKDIQFFLKRKINKFAFYRLGGFNKDYQTIIKKFL